MDVFSKPKASSVTTAPSFDSSDSEAEDKVTAKKAKAAPKRKVVNTDNSDSESDNLMSRLKAKAVGSKASVSTELWSERMSLTKEGSSSGQIVAECFLSLSQKPKKRVIADETFNISHQEAPVTLAARNNPSRARKPVIYNLDSDSDEDF